MVRASLTRSACCFLWADARPVAGEAAVAEGVAEDLGTVGGALGGTVMRDGDVRTATLQGPAAALAAVGVTPAWSVGGRAGVRVLVVSWSADALRDALAALGG